MTPDLRGWSGVLWLLAWGTPTFALLFIAALLESIAQDVRALRKEKVNDD